MSLIIRTKLNNFISGVRILWDTLINNFSWKECVCVCGGGGGGGRGEGGKGFEQLAESFENIRSIITQFTQTHYIHY